MDSRVISVQCLDYVPRQVLITIMGPDGIVYNIAVNEAQYKILALLPVFPADPCAA